MSDYESFKGTLRVLKDNKSKKDLLLDGVKNGDFEIPDYYDLNNDRDVNEMFSDELSEKFVESNGVMYIIEEKSELDVEDDIFKCESIGNNRFSYIVKYYNGGCGFEEAIEEAIDNIVINQLTIEDIKFSDLRDFWKELKEIKIIAEWKAKVIEFKDIFNLTNSQAINFANKNFKTLLK